MGSVSLPTKYKVWITAAAVVVLLAVFYVIGGVDKANRAKREAKSTPSGIASSTSASLSASTSTPPPSPSATSSPDGSLNWSEEVLEAGGTPALHSGVTLINTFISVCAGKRVATAAYAGRTHPLVIIGPSADPIGYQWERTVADRVEYRLETGHPVPSVLRPQLVTQVQLIACVTEKLVPAKSCGNYTRSSDGVSGELRLTKGTATVRILSASSGGQLASRTFERPPPACPSTAGGITAATSPPWVLDGETPTLKEAHDFVLSLTTGPAR